MDEEKTTKEILEEKSRQEQYGSIYTPESTKGLVNAFEKWRNTAESQDVRVNWHTAPHVVLGSEIPRGLLYTPIDVNALDYEKNLGFPEGQPYTRGIHANMYRGREFTIRQLSGFAGPEDTNKRIKFLSSYMGPQAQT